MSITLASNGFTAYSIVCAPSAHAAERRAAGELARFLREMTDADFPVLPAAPDNPAVLRVGGGDNLPVFRGGEDFLVRVDEGGTVTLTGASPRGTLYAVYAFLETLGCRWFTPTVSRIPHRSELTLEPFERAEHPAFEYREPFFTEAFDGAWASRNRVNGEHMHLSEDMGGRVAYGMFVHTFDRLLPVADNYDAHPEYYSEVGGKRLREHTQLCLTNPDVLALVTERLRAEILAHPEARIFSVSQNDCYNPCECENCRRVDAEEGSHAGTLLRFVNAVAEALEPEFPDVLFDTLAYQYTRPAPRLTRPRPNVVVRLCSIECCFTHPLGTCDHFRVATDPDRNATFLTDLEDWARLTDRLYIWDYVTNFNAYLLPYPNTEVLAPNLRFFRDHSVAGVFEEGAYPKGGGGYCAELHAYLLAKLMWDPTLDEAVVIDEFLTGVYGMAAPAMRRVFLAYRAQIEREGVHLEFAVDPLAVFLDAGFIREARALFDEALRMADDERVLREVRKAELWQRFLELTHEPKSDDRNRRVDDYVADCKAFGIGALLEWTDIDSYAANMKEYDLRL